MASIAQFNTICGRCPIEAVKFAEVSREPQVLWAARKLLAGEWRINGSIVPPPALALQVTQQKAESPKRETLSLPTPRSQPKLKNGAARAAADKKREARRQRDIERHQKKAGLSRPGKQEGGRKGKKG